MNESFGSVLLERPTLTRWKGQLIDCKFAVREIVSSSHMWIMAEKRYRHGVRGAECYVRISCMFEWGGSLFGRGARSSGNILYHKTLSQFQVIAYFEDRAELR